MTPESKAAIDAHIAPFRDFMEDVDAILHKAGISSAAHAKASTAVIRAAAKMISKQSAAANTEFELALSEIEEERLRKVDAT